MSYCRKWQTAKLSIFYIISQSFLHKSFMSYIGEVHQLYRDGYQRSWPEIRLLLTSMSTTLRPRHRCFGSISRRVYREPRRSLRWSEATSEPGCWLVEHREEEIGCFYLEKNVVYVSTPCRTLDENSGAPQRVLTCWLYICWKLTHLGGGGEAENSVNS